MGEKHREKRIEEILNVATEVFLEKGYSNTTMEDIINATTLSKGGFYYYFKSTKEIFFKIFDQKCDTETIKLIENLDKNMTKEEIINEICEEFAQGVLERFDERTLYLMTITEITNDPDFRKYYFQMVEKSLGIIEKLLLEKLPHVDPVIFEDRMRFLVSVANALLVQCYFYQEEDLYKRNMDDVKNIFMQILSGI